MPSKRTALFCAVLAACTLTVTAARAEDTSRAVVLNDTQLDEITAGTVDMQHIVINNGNALVDKINNRHIECVNCLPFGDSGKTIVVMIVQNPAQIITHSVHFP